MEFLRAFFFLICLIGLSIAVPIGLKKLKTKIFPKRNGKGGSCCS